MQIQPTNNLSEVHQTRMGSAQVKSETQTGVRTPVDQLDFSPEAQMMMSGVNSGIRADKVADLRMQIASGRYETAQKIEMAVERLLDAFA